MSAQPQPVDPETLSIRERRQLQVCEDVEWLAGTCPPDELARRIGYANQLTLGRSLRRWGRLDLCAKAGIYGV